MEDPIFKFNVTLDRRIPDDKEMIALLEGVPAKRRGHLVRSLIAEGMAYRGMRKHFSAIQAAPTGIPAAVDAEDSLPSFSSQVETPLIKKDLFAS